MSLSRDIGSIALSSPKSCAASCASLCCFWANGKFEMKKKGNCRCLRHYFMQQPKPLGLQQGRQDAHASRVTAGTIEARHQTELYRIVGDAEQDRQFRGRGLSGQRRRFTAQGNKYCYRLVHKLRRLRRQSIILAICPTVLDGDVLALRETSRRKTLVKRCNEVFRIFRRSRAEKSDDRQRCRLRSRNQRPSRR